MYELGGGLDDAGVSPGSNLLVTGPPMVGKRDLSFDFLGRGRADGEAAVVVSATERADDVRDRLVGRGDAPVGVVDCVSRQQGVSPGGEEPTVRYAASPADLTGVGIEFVELLRLLHRERGVDRFRTLLHSVSTLLIYADLQTVFRFLHVFTGRIQSADGLGLFVLDETSHDERTRSTLHQLFDGAVEVRGAGDGREARPVGLPDVDERWRSL